MKINKIPFNVDILDTKSQKLKSLRPTTSQDILDATGGNFHENGLFSTLTFGRVGEEERELRFSYIDIKTTIFHPVIFKTLTKIKGLYKDILLGRAYAEWDDKLKDFVLSNEITGNTGFSFFMSHWEDIKFKETNSAIRSERVKLIEKYKHLATTSKIMVMPAGLRDFEIDSTGKATQDEINDIYKKILNISKVIADTDDNVNSPVLDNTRRLLQERFNEIYETVEKMITGKKGFIQNKFGGRKIFNGTRNVISALDTSTEQLGGLRSPKFNDTVIGLYQTLKGCLPLAIHQLRYGYLNEVFGEGSLGTQVWLTNTKTLKKELVELPLDVKDKWVTIEGLEKIINGFSNVDRRFKPIMIEGHYLGLIYKGPDKTFKIFGDIEELPEHLNRDFVEPLTYVELLYLSGYRKWNTLKAVITRYPITDIGSTYISSIYCKTTIDSEVRYELDNNWELKGEDYVALEFPNKKHPIFIDSMKINPSRLKELGGDKNVNLLDNNLINLHKSSLLEIKEEFEL